MNRATIGWTTASVLALALAMPHAGAGEEGLRTAFGPEGLTSIAYDGDELLVAKSQPEVDATAPGKTPIKFKQPPRCAFKDGVWTQTWDGLEIVARLQQDKDVLNMAVTLRNTGSLPVAKADYRPFRLHFPKRPQGGRWYWGYEVSTETEESPGVLVADWGKNKLALCVEAGSAVQTAEDVARPMTIGFGGNYGPFDSSVKTPVFFRTSFEPPLDPGKQWTFRASVRLASSATPLDKVAGDIYARFAKAMPFVLNWPDRRPIGALFMARDNTKWKTNPRGYFNDEKVDITTDAGRAAFRERLLKFADTSVAEVKKTGGQGVIVWDIEGDQMPHAITYLGDPRVLPQEAPEMDACADEFFKKFLDAGLKTGVCIRPSKVISDGKGGWKHQQVDDHVGDMADKIAYAKKRWGCTIFYMDTNVKWAMHRLEEDQTRGMWQGEARLLTTAEIRELCRRNPDVFIFPEFGHVGYRSACGVYAELTGANQADDENAPRTSDEIRLIYPQACTVVTSKGDYLSYWKGLRKGIMGGDIHLFRGWFGDTDNAYIKQMYEEVDFLRRAASVQKNGTIEDLLADADPLVRFTAVSRLTKPDAGQAATLVKALSSEKEWVVRRRIVEALGASGDASAVPALAGLARDASGLGRFAATALGKIGAPATQTLLGLATDKDRRLVEMSLQALAGYGDPAATPTLLSLTERPDAALRALAARALGSRSSPEVTKRLVALLEDKDASVVCAACASLGKLEERTATKALVDLIVRSATQLHNNDIRSAAGNALEAITGLQYGPYEARWKKALDEGQLPGTGKP
ncbi:MAG: HEAT repeat domain-containing protein [Planctomycetota bacterium]|nr:HEAT repeat domain-containing protein [Planctomycetota bacterium]